MSDGTITLDPSRHRLPRETVGRIFNEHIEPLVLGDCLPAEPPQAVLVGGQVGCGTAAAVRLARDALGGAGAAVEIVLDELRAFHPRYAELLARDGRLASYYTEADAQQWLQMCVERAIDARMPLVLEGAIRSEEVIVHVFRRLQEAGYHVEARVLAVPAAVSSQTTQLVHELVRGHTGAARPVTPGAHQATYDGLPLMLDRVERERLADVVTVYDRHGRCRYRHDLASGDKAGATSAVTALRVHRSLPLSLGELRTVLEDHQWLEQRLNAPGRDAPPDDVLRAESQRWEAHCAVLAEAFLTLPERECRREFPQLAAAFERLREVTDTAARMPDGELGELLAKKARETFARRIANGNFGVAGSLPF